MRAASSLSREFGLTVSGLGLLALSAAPALAQQCGLRNHIRLAHGMCNTTGESETRLDTGIVGVGPLVTAPNIVRDNGCGCHSELSAIMSSDYGSLSYSVTAAGNSCACCGIFLWADEWIGGSPKAQFFDRLTVQSASLPIGTPITFRVEMSLTGGVSASNASTERSFSGDVQISAGANASLSLANQAGVVTREFTVPVGQYFDLTAHLNCTLRDYALLSFNQTGTIGANLAQTVRIETLTSGASITSCSGHVYDPAPACAADFNRDGTLDPDDLADYIAAFFSIPPGSGSDFNGDGLTDPDDLADYIAAFFTGC